MCHGSNHEVRVSVIVPVFNGARDLPALLAALGRQSADRATTEYIVVDNGSTDGTRALVLDHAKTAGLHLRCLEETATRSSYAARNTGIRAARGRMLLFTDADCVPAPDWVDRLAAALDRPGVGAAAGAVLPAPGDSLLEAFAVRAEILSQDHALNHWFRPYGQTTNLAVRREVFVEAGLFRSGLTTGGDADLCWRMQAATPATLVYDRSAVVLHRHRTTLAGLGEQFRRYGRSTVYLRHLHGLVERRSPRLSYYVRKLLRWGLLKLPRLAVGRMTGRVERVDLYMEPLMLFLSWSTRAGARAAQAAPIPVARLAIEYLDPGPVDPAPVGANDG